jgi:cold shock CspA family protein
MLCALTVRLTVFSIGIHNADTCGSYTGIESPKRNKHTGSTAYKGTTMKGKLVRYFEDKGYGFLQTEDKQFYFLHISQVQDEDEIQVGDRFSFEPKETDRGLQAVNCTRIYPAAVR